MIDNFYAVIMAGGGGTRLWPLSRHSRPKQMLKLGSEETLFQLATARLQGLIPPERILVVTVESMAVELQKLVPQIPADNYLLEPAPRGTASVVGLAAAFLKKRDAQAVMAVLTADHMIENVALFQNLLSDAEKTARAGYLVTLGIDPTQPSTAYGYIQRGQKVESAAQLPVYQVESFREKPDLATAEMMLKTGLYSWNSGMFIWTVNAIWAEFERQMPDLFKTLNSITQAVGTPQQAEVIASLWPAIKPQTIDYGIMEGAQGVVVIPAANLGWSDVGSWDSLYDVLETDEHGNVKLSQNVILLDSEKTLVVSEAPERLIAAIGVKDLILVDTGDVFLVCHSSKAQQVREVVDHLKKTGGHQYL